MELSWQNWKLAYVQKNKADENWTALYLELAKLNGIIF